MKKYYGESWSKVVELLESNIYSGLNQEQCNIRKSEFGDNLINLPYTRSNLQIFLIYLKKNTHIFIFCFNVFTKQVLYNRIISL